MKLFKKICSLFLAAAFTVSAASCSAGTSSSSSPSSSDTSSSEAAVSQAAESTLEDSSDAVTIRIGALKGPTGLGMLQLMQEAADGEKPYTFTLAGAADELTGKITTGELDAVALPTNSAAALYNKTGGEIQIAMVNTLGVLYLVTAGDESISTVSDLAGKTVYSSGQGTVAQYAFEYILSANGLEPGKDVTVEDADATLAAYKDADQVSDWAKDAMAWSVENGIFGVDTDELWAKQNIQRSAVATIAVRFQPEALPEA